MGAMQPRSKNNSETGWAPCPACEVRDLHVGPWPAQWGTCSDTWFKQRPRMHLEREMTVFLCEDTNVSVYPSPRQTSCWQNIPNHSVSEGRSVSLSFFAHLLTYHSSLMHPNPHADRGLCMTRTIQNCLPALVLPLDFFVRIVYILKRFRGKVFFFFF